MGKKNKRTYVFEEEFKELGKMAPGIKALLSMTRDIAEGYRKFRKKGGEAIPGLEKHLAVKKCECVADPEPETTPEPLPAATAVTKKSVAKKPAKKQPAKAPAKEVNAGETETTTGEATQVTMDMPQA
ncbi:MAG: hypothetical protein HXX11_08210 [Desulfuromonadales bacterium]|nr:hypothetical protein [Desulfuromonadales bacterium]